MLLVADEVVEEVGELALERLFDAVHDDVDDQVGGVEDWY